MIAEILDRTVVAGPLGMKFGYRVNVKSGTDLILYRRPNYTDSCAAVTLTFYDESVHIAGVHANPAEVPYADPEFDTITMAQVFSRLDGYDQMVDDLGTKFEMSLRRAGR